MTTIASQAQTFTTLVNFNGTNGANPTNGALVQGIDGGLFGTTAFGGSDSCVSGCGTVFRITPAGKLTTLYSFDDDGGYPYSGLAQAAIGDFYGSAKGTNGDGTIFIITPSGELTKICNFDGTDGIAPDLLVQASNRDLYGVTSAGGASANCPGGCGTVFKITPGGILTTLYDFCSSSSTCPDGSDPQAGLVQALNGDLYGSTVYGGTGSNCQYGCGTIFKITPDGTLTTLHSFDGTDGEYPVAALVETEAGDFYGTTVIGGTDDDGTIFRMTASGALTTLHNFTMTDGAQPYAVLALATDGDLYGTTFYGGANGNGTIFGINYSGKLTTLHSFSSACHEAGLIQATNGVLYGTTCDGGSHDAGTVFSFSVGLGPFVKTLPTSGKVGSVLRILGTDLTGATSVTFNGIPAAFTIASASNIETSVPNDATTGEVQVVTLNGTLSSNVAFRVGP